MKELPINQIIQGDCLEVLSSFPAESVDLVVTSPPYDNLRDYKGYSFNFDGIAKEMYRVLKVGGVIVWVVGDATIDGSESGTSFRQALFFKEIGLNLHDTMIYLKNSPAFPDSVRYGQVFEYMFILSKGKPKTFNPIMDKKNRWTESFGKSSNRQKDGTIQQKEKIVVKDFGMRFNTWKYNTGFGYSTKDEIAFEHPAIYPEDLAADHIKSWSNDGDIVLDPMCGSGTTLKMARALNRNYIGIDISDEYCELARKRINSLPKPMF